MAKRVEIFKRDIIDKKLILPSFINKKYLEEKFNDLEKAQKEELNNDFNHNKIIIENKKWTIVEVDKAKNLENKIYESDDFTEVIKKLTKIKIKKNHFNLELIENMKNGIFIIESEDLAIYGAFFLLNIINLRKKLKLYQKKKID